MSEGDGMAEVTEGDREKASGLLHCMVAGSNRGIVCSCGWEGRGINHERHAEDAIAAALAEEREKARAPFLALADEYDLIPLDHAEARRIVRKVADRIRRAAEEG